MGQLQFHKRIRTLHWARFIVHECLHKQLPELCMRLHSRNKKVFRVDDLYAPLGTEAI